MTFLNPLNALIPNIPFSIFCRFWGLGHLRGPGVSLGRILGISAIEPLFLGWGSSQGALSTPSPPIESPPVLWVVSGSRPGVDPAGAGGVGLHVWVHTPERSWTLVCSGLPLSDAGNVSEAPHHGAQSTERDALITAGGTWGDFERGQFCGESFVLQFGAEQTRH